jgi:hypothetical protein
VIEQSPARQPDLLFAAAEIAAWLGDTARALRIYASELINASFYGQATLWASLGEGAKSIAVIEVAIEDPELSTAWLKTDIRSDRIRASAGFNSAVETLELNLAWFRDEGFSGVLSGDGC